MERIADSPIFLVLSAIASVAFEQFFRLLVKQEMVAAKMRAAHMPMEVLRLEVEAARGGY
jgi:hypothetical protein